MKKNPSFRISSGLKSLIGKELITDEYIAIFELVKNSFDAKANNVQIIFENIYSSNPRIVILDDGKGMDYYDIENKWLFVAYSAKSDGSEDFEEINSTQDYRTKLQSKRYFAGAKGVGRFSCDRLGSILNMITIKSNEDADIENIKVDWEKFESDLKQEFVNIKIEYQVLKQHSYKIKHGTILEISNLRDSWNRAKILNLKKSLEKLINPNQQNVDDFNIEIIAIDELHTDTLKNHDREKVNGFVKNIIFETLNLKTTSIETEISSDGKFILTRLKDRGEFIYQIKEKNPFPISDINSKLFFLNRSAKNNFKRTMGVDSVSYGSVFLYKNGFRIYPFGEEGEDPLKLDRRKAQGYARYLGTRDLIGRIEIFGENPSFKETTSRDGGLLKNDSYDSLVDFFIDKSLRRLEKYVVDVIRWGEPYKLNREDIDYQPALNPVDVKNEIVETIKLLSRSDNFIEVHHNPNFFELLEESQSNSATKVMQNLSTRVLNSQDKELQEEVKKVEIQFNKLNNERKEINIEIDKKNVELQITKKELKEITGQNLLWKSVTTTDTKELISLQHQINHSTVRINKNLDILKAKISEGAKKEDLYKNINIISIENSKISTISKFVTKANFNLTSRTITKDLVQFINEYLKNVYEEYKDLRINNQQLKVSIVESEEINFEVTFRPLEIIIAIDNLLNNAYKANAKNIIVTWEKINDNQLVIRFKDDGRGIPKDIEDKIFDFGFTTTDGSGLGLYHVKEIMKKFGGSITINRSLESGAEFILEVKK